jgi:integrase
MHFCMHSKSQYRFHDHTSDRLDEGMKMARKANGQGHTYKVGNSYRTAIRKGGFTITAMGATAQESRKRAKAKLDALPNLGRANNSQNNSKVNLQNYLSTWLEEEHKHHIAHSTFTRYKALAKCHINPAIGEIQLKKLTSTHILSLLKRMRESGQSARSQQQARALLSVALQDAERNDLISTNPVKRVRSPQVKRIEIDPLTINEVKRLISTYAGTYLEARLHIALICGLRQGEALGLTWDDIDFENQTMKIHKQVQVVNRQQVFTNLKTDKSRRVIALTSETTMALKSHRRLIEQQILRAEGQWEEGNLVFPNEMGSFRSPAIDYADWKKALKLCGIQKKRLHDARHTAATLMYSQGVGIETISRALGHSTSAITSKLYVHNSLEPQVVAAEAMNQLLID